MRIILLRNILISVSGLLKEEFRVLNGSFVGLSSKCYHVFDKSNGCSKIAMKGIQKESNITQKDFLDLLYKDEQVVRNQVRFQYSKQHDMMTVVSQEKKALSSIYTKLCVQDDRVSIKPLSRNGKFL